MDIPPDALLENILDSFEENGSALSDKEESAESLWYLSTELERVIAYPEVPAESEGVTVRVPRTYETTFKDLDVKIEFFTEAYALGSLIQARISVTNRSDSDLSYVWNTDSIACFRRDPQGDSACLKATPFRSATDPNDYVDTVLTDALPIGGTAVLERIYIADPAFFSEGEEYIFELKLNFGGGYPDLYAFVPVEVVTPKNE